jgi:hypothetical protein
MIQDHEIDAWLGDARGDLTDEQWETFASLVRDYERQIAQGREGEAADFWEEDSAAWVAALEQVEGRLDVAARGRAYRDAKDAAYAGAIIATLAGMSEVQAADDATITRATLRKALGK